MKQFFSKIISSRFAPIFLLTFINGLSMMMLYPILPFIVRFYGQSEVILGLLMWIFSLFQFLASPILWALSDKYGRRQILILTQAGTMLSWLVLAGAYFSGDSLLLWIAATPIVIIFISRIFDGITGWNVSVAQAMIADLTHVDERTKVFGMNGAVFGLSLIIWPALWAISMTFGYGYLGTALLWFCLSALTLGVMIYVLRESLPEEKRNEELHISFRSLNLFSQIQKWSRYETIRYTLIMKLFMFIAFVGYTSISTLYLIDVFDFSDKKVGYYLTFTGLFLIFHQTITIRYFLEKFKDRKSLLIWLACMWWGFTCMWFSSNIFMFTVFYFFAVLGISLCFTTLGSLTSRSVDEKNQWSVMGMMTWLESFISIWVPVLATFFYTYIPFSFYLLIALLPFCALILNRVFYAKTEFLPAKKV